MPTNFKFATVRHAAGFVSAARSGRARGTAGVRLQAGHGGHGGDSQSRGAHSLARKQRRASPDKSLPF